MTEQEKTLAERVAYLEDNVQGLLDFSFHMAKLMVHRDLDDASPEEVPDILSRLRAVGRERVGAESHTAETLILQLCRDITAERAKE